MSKGQAGMCGIFLPDLKASSTSRTLIRNRKGDILFISPAMWTNVMAPKKLAQKMSDEEVASTASQQAAVVAEELLKARVLQDMITNMPRIVIERKVGLGKNLFGSVTHKQLVEMLKERFPNNVTGPTSAIITEIKGDNLIFTNYNYFTIFNNPIASF
jgi:Ribosomal protein L9, C-terminal domain